MSRMIFISLPVTDLPRAEGFYTALGFTKNPDFSDGDGACMVWSEAIYVMLLTHAKWQGFTTRPVTPVGSSEVSLALSVDSRAEVDALVAAGRKAQLLGIPGADHGFDFRSGGLGEQIERAAVLAAARKL